MKMTEQQKENLIKYNQENMDDFDLFRRGMLQVIDILTQLHGVNDEAENILDFITSKEYTEKVWGVKSRLYPEK